MRFTLLILLLTPLTAFADYPNSFSEAKRIAERDVYYDHRQTFYCSCNFAFDDVADLDGDGNKTETVIKPASCGYKPRKATTRTGKVNERTTRIEWEHIVPAHVLGGNLDEWKNKTAYPECRKSNGKFLSGRDCAYKLNPAFRQAHNDINNLVPSIGELNADRSNYPYGVIAGEPRIYGQCDFEVDFDKNTAEPADNIKGDIARVYLHMIQTYGVIINDDMLQMMQQWNKLDPVSEWECVRNKRIGKAQGKDNHYVSEHCSD